MPWCFLPFFFSGRAKPADPLKEERARAQAAPRGHTSATMYALTLGQQAAAVARPQRLQATRQRAGIAVSAHVQRKACVQVTLHEADSALIALLSTLSQVASLSSLRGLPGLRAGRAQAPALPAAAKRGNAVVARAGFGGGPDDQQVHVDRTACTGLASQRILTLDC